MKHQNYVLVDSAKKLSRLIEICKIYNVKFTDQDDYPTYRMFGRRLSGGYWLSSEYTGIPITIPEFVAHLEAEEKPASILSDKCAIQINNKREFILLNEHYKSKGWIMSGSKTSAGSINSSFPQVKFYDNSGNGYSNRESSINSAKEQGYNVITFSDFAKEVGITVPVFIMKSEDGVDLYEGDYYESAKRFDGNLWQYSCRQRLYFGHLAFTSPNIVKAFSTKEAAKKWIEEQNKPKEIEIEIHSKGSVLITSDMVRINGVVTKFTPREIESIYKAFQSLQ